MYIAGCWVNAEVPLEFWKFKLPHQKHDSKCCIAAEPIMQGWWYSHGALCFQVKSISWWASEAAIYRWVIQSNSCLKTQLHCWSAHQKKQFSCHGAEKCTLWLPNVIHAWCIIYWAFSCQTRAARVLVHIALCCSSSYLCYQGTMCQIEPCCVAALCCHLNSHTQSSPCCRLSEATRRWTWTRQGSWHAVSNGTSDVYDTISWQVWTYCDK